MQVLVGGGDGADELVVGVQGGQLVGGQAREELDGVLCRLGPAARADALEEITGRRVPRPAQVAGEHAESLDAGRQDGADVEASDGLHEEKHRGRCDGFLQTLQPPFHPSGRQGRSPPGRVSVRRAFRYGRLRERQTNEVPSEQVPASAPRRHPQRAGRGDRRGRGGRRAPRSRSTPPARLPPSPVCRVVHSRWDASPSATSVRSSTAAPDRRSPSSTRSSRCGPRSSVRGTTPSTRRRSSPTPTATSTTSPCTATTPAPRSGRRPWPPMRRAGGPTGSRAGPTPTRRGSTTPASRSRPGWTRSSCAPRASSCSSASRMPCAVRAPTPRRSTRGCEALKDTGSPAAHRYGAATSPEIQGLAALMPLREFVSLLARLHAPRRARARPLRCVVRDLPPLRGMPCRRGDRAVGVGHVPLRGAAPARDRRDGLRRHLPDADPPDRHDGAQGPQQQPRRGAR